MKKILLFLVTAAASAQQIHVLDFEAGGLVYSPYDQMYYASLAAENGANENHLAKISTSGVVQQLIPFTGNPGILAISHDGQKLYCGLNGIPAIRSFDIATGISGSEFSLGSSTVTGNFYAGDIVVLPGSGESIAVARRNLNHVPRHEGVAIFDNGIIRPKTTFPYVGSDQIEEWPTGLIGYSNETASHNVRQMPITNAGASNASGHYSPAISGNLTFKTFGNRSIYSNGVISTYTNASQILGICPDVDGPGIFDADSNSYIFASADESGFITLKRFGGDDHELLSVFAVSGISGQPADLVSDGSSLAFRTQDKIIFITGLLLSTDETTISQIEMYPNPAGDFLGFSQTVSGIRVLSMSGAEILKIAEKRDRFDVSKLSSGPYIIEIVTDNGVFTQKLLKR